MGQALHRSGLRPIVFPLLHMMPEWTENVTLVMPSLRVVLSLNQTSDNVKMTLIEETWRLGDEIGLLNCLSWK